MMREAGLPILTPDVHGESFLLFGSKGVVRTLYPDLWRVDLETEDGSLLTYVPVIGPYFPELHKDADQPSHAGYLYIRGTAQAFCWPLTHRRVLGPQDSPEGQSGEDQPERRYYHLHNYIFRSGDITVRITKNHELVFETEEGDYIELNTKTREIRLHAPTVYVGTKEDANRIQYEQDDSIRLLMPLILLGTEIGDRIQYKDGVEILLQAPLIKLTAEDIILDPVSIKLGHQNATERALLGDLWMAFYNTFVTLFNSHTHTNVQNGPNVSGGPSTPTPAMTDAILSDVTRISKTGL
jgi:hypothetical protein